MKFILGQKAAMSQIFTADGKVVPVTVIKAGPCTVTQVKKDNTKDGYHAVQLGFGLKKSLSKPLAGHLKALNNFKVLKEFRTDKEVTLSRGQLIKVGTFQPGDQIKVTGVSKGKGFQGVVKRHGFSGSPASHGHKDQLRMPGSIGSQGPQRVIKGKRMAGRMGGEQVSLTNLEVVKVDEERDLLYLKGAVPGARGGLLLIQGPGELKLAEETTAKIKEETLITNQSEVTESDPTAKQSAASDNQPSTSETL